MVLISSFQTIIKEKEKVKIPSSPVLSKLWIFQYASRWWCRRGWIFAWLEVNYWWMLHRTVVLRLPQPWIGQENMETWMASHFCVLHILNMCSPFFLFFPTRNILKYFEIFFRLTIVYCQFVFILYCIDYFLVTFL